MGCSLIGTGDSYVGEVKEPPRLIIAGIVRRLSCGPREAGQVKRKGKRDRSDPDIFIVTLQSHNNEPCRQQQSEQSATRSSGSTQS